MNAASRFFALVLISLVLAVPAGVGRAQVTADVGAEAGLDGWLDSAAPFDLVVTVTSDVLYDGSIQATMGSVVVASPAQVPAGTTKVFNLVMPPPTSGAIRVDLLDADGDRVATSRVTPRFATDEVLVGVTAGGPSDEIGRLRTPIVDRDVVAVAVDGDDQLDVLDYLVTDGLGEPEIRFIESGGVVVTESNPPVDAVQVTPGPPARYRLGDGEIIVVSSLSQVDTYDDFIIARERETGPLEFWQSPDQGLSEAATNAGSGGVPDLPWLFGAIIGYTVLIGPVNFLVLKRLRRRDWAWLTIPAISVIALGVFWFVGGERLDEASLTHAAVIIGGDQPIERTSIVLAVGSEGSYTLGFDETDIVYPATLGNRFDEFGRPIATASGEVFGSEVEFDLQQLGFAGVNTIGEPSEVPLAVDWGDGADDPVQIVNQGDFSFWAWGVFDDGTYTVSDEPLAPGATGELQARSGRGEFFGPEFGFQLGDAVINQLQLFGDDRAWRVLSPLGNAAQFSLGSATSRFVFAFSEDFRPDVTLDGRSVSSEGNALVIVPVEDSGVVGSQKGTLLAIGNGFVDPGGAGPGIAFVSSDEMWLGYRLPADVRAARLEWIDQFGGADGLGQQAWDWETGRLVDVSVGELLDARFIDPAGNVVLRVGANRQEFEGGFVELPMSPQSYELVWGEE